MQAITSPAQIRNVVLVGSQGSGKTTLFEHLLRARIDGYRGEKIDSERSAALSVASITQGDTLITLIDAPGHPDHISELRAGLTAADAAIFVISAVDGIDPVTSTLWRECQRVNMPRIIVVTKMDIDRGRFLPTVELCRETLGSGVHPAFVPVVENNEVVGNMSLVTYKVHDYSSGSRVAREATEEEIVTIDELRDAYLQEIFVESENEESFLNYSPGDQVVIDEILHDLDKAMRSGNFHPALPVLSTNGVGTEELLKLIDAAFPYPRPTSAAVATFDGEPVEINADPDGPLVAQVIRTTSDQYAGRQSLIRVWSGTLKSDEQITVASNNAVFGVDEVTGPEPHRSDEKLGAISQIVGQSLVNKSSAIAGEIVIVSKLQDALTTDTISKPDKPLLVEPWLIPTPQLPVAIRAASRNDEDKLSSALQRLMIEDSSVRIERPVETDQLVLWTQGQSHAELVQNRLAERYQVQVNKEPVKVALRETFIKPAKGHGRHVKQSGGHGQFGDCWIEIAPGARGSGFEFVDKVVGGAVPRQFIPSVEKGIVQMLAKGVISGYPMTDLVVTLFDGKAHSVDSSDMAFQTAGQLALKDAANDSNVALLEPIDEVKIVVGDEFMGQVTSDIANRRGQMLGTDSDGHGSVTITAYIPAIELVSYAIDLRGLAQGTGSFSRKFHGYELMPDELAKKFKTKE